MKFGCCSTLANADALRDAGFDFIEINVQNNLCGEIDDAGYEATRPDFAVLPLSISAANCLMPGSIPVVGPNQDVTQQRTYLQRVAHRAAQAGIRHLVFGSGGARRMPDGYPVECAINELVDFCRLAGDLFAAEGLTLAVEHLNRGETNTINDLDSMRRLVERVDHEHVRALIDTYHLGREDISIDEVRSVLPQVVHVHVAVPSDRRAPGTKPTDPSLAGFDFAAFFGVLKSGGYSGSISVEAEWKNPLSTEAQICVEYLRETWRTS